MELVRLLPPSVRSAWLGVFGIVAVSGALVGIGFAAGLVYCESRRVSEFQQLAGVTKEILPFAAQCMATLTDVVPAAIIFARNDRPRPVPVAVRDSLRAARWSTPP